MTERKRVDFTLKLDPVLRDRLEAVKERDDRSLGWLIEKCIEAHLPSLENPGHYLNERAPASAVRRGTLKR